MAAKIILIDPDHRLRSLLAASSHLADVEFLECGERALPALGCLMTLLSANPNAPVVLDMARGAAAAWNLLCNVRAADPTAARPVLLTRPPREMGLDWALETSSIEAPHVDKGVEPLAASLAAILSRQALYAA